MMTACLRTATAEDRAALALAGAPLPDLDRLVAAGRVVVAERQGRLTGFAAIDPAHGLVARVLDATDAELARWLRWYAETAAYLAAPMLLAPAEPASLAA
jgi:hypothetical protein